MALRVAAEGAHGANEQTGEGERLHRIDGQRVALPGGQRPREAEHDEGADRAEDEKGNKRQGKDAPHLVAPPEGVGSEMVLESATGSPAVETIRRRL
jgi:hypothetical protein